MDTKVNWIKKILKERIHSDLEIEIENNSYKIFIYGINNFFIKCPIDNSLYSSEFKKIVVLKEINFVDFHNLALIGIEKGPKILIENKTFSCSINYDFIGLIFFMLARVEEYNFISSDPHSRFLSKDSILSNYDLIERPIVDEWIFVIRSIFEKKVKNIKLQKTNYKLCISHDVDRPARYNFANKITRTKRFVKDVFFNNRYREFFKLLKCYLFNNNTYIPKEDDYNTFDWILSNPNWNKYETSFFFMSGKTGHDSDPDYQLKSPPIQNLIEKIHKKNGVIGIHPSYYTFDNFDNLKNEFDVFNRNIKNIIDDNFYLVNRMHYLRFSFPKTLLYLEKLGVSVDESIGFADKVGFRCGTSYEYPAFDFINNVKLKIKIKPLIAMQWSLNGPNYMNMSMDEGFIYLNKIIKQTKKYGGNFTYLVHNDELYDLGEEFKNKLELFISKQC
tara:strand:+ start:10390 stop:11727 length:1338 start_codon:yes stop_codon:yes gene_type:complete